MVWCSGVYQVLRLWNVFFLFFRIILLSAEQLLKRKNIQGTIDLLSSIKPTDSCYKEAKAKHAEILLKYRKDKNAYIQCYKNFAEETADVESYTMIGDAYMKILGMYVYLLKSELIYFFL